MDSTLRIISFISAGICAAVLISSMAMRLRHDPPLLTRSQVLAQSGFAALLVSVFYGTGEVLWNWPHLRLYILTLSVMWAIPGCIGLFVEARQETRRVTRKA